MCGGQRSTLGSIPQEEYPSFLETLLHESELSASGRLAQATPQRCTCLSFHGFKITRASYITWLSHISSGGQTQTILLQNKHVKTKLSSKLWTVLFLLGLSVERSVTLPVHRRGLGKPGAS